MPPAKPFRPDMEKIAAARDELLAAADVLSAVLDGKSTQYKAAEELGMKPNRFSRHLAEKFSGYVRSRTIGLEDLPALLEEAMGGDERLLRDLFGVPSGTGELVIMPETDHEALWDAIDAILPPRRARAVALYYGRDGDPMDDGRAAEAMGLRPDHVRHVRAAGMRQLRVPANVRRLFPALGAAYAGMAAAAAPSLEAARARLSGVIATYDEAAALGRLADRLETAAETGTADPEAREEAVRHGCRPMPVPPDEDAPLEDLDLSTRSYNALKRAGVDTLAGLAAMGLDDARSVRNLGEESIRELDLLLERRLGRGFPHREGNP